MTKWLAGLALSLAMVFPAQMAMAVEKVAPGNVHAEQPRIPNSAANRTRALNTTFDRKYDRVVALLRNERGLIRDIKRTANQFGIDPIHIVGAIVGEHTYNVDALDRAQTYVVKAMSYINQGIDFAYKGESVSDFIARPQFQPCERHSDSLTLWTCRERIWQQQFQGKTVDGKSYPNDRFSVVFFQPFFAGQTFGLGQVEALTALMMTDRVSRVTGTRPLTHKRGEDVYETIMDPKKTLPYIAAILATAIDDYKRYAGFDISGNPGLTTTLYNTGGSRQRAKALGARNRAGENQVPQENYYGWLINDREAELRALLN